MLPLDLYARVRVFCAQIAHETAGAACTRSSLRPLFQEGNRSKARAIRAARLRAMPSRGPGEQNMAKSFLGKINNVVAVARETLGIAGRYMVKVPSGGTGVAALPHLLV